MKKIPVGNVVEPQHLRSIVVGQVPNPNQPPRPPEVFANGIVMDIYTGWVMCDYASSGFVQDEIISFVPLGKSVDNFTLQGYPKNPLAPSDAKDLGVLYGTAIAYASMASFGHSPTVAALDSATVKVKPQNVSGVTTNVLVLSAKIGVDDGTLHRIAYQVTVFGYGDAVDYPNLVVQVGPAQTVPNP